MGPRFGGAGQLDLVTSVPVIQARQIEFQGDYAWVAQNLEGATLLDVSAADRPRIVRRFPPEAMQPLYFRIFHEDNRLISADRFRGLIIYDVSQPDNPTTVSALPVPRMTTGLDVAQTTSGRRIAVLARAGDGLASIDITDEKSPRLVDEYTTGVEFTRSVVVRDGLVYAADSEEGGLKVLRLMEDGSFQPLYQVNYPGKCLAVAVTGDYLVAGYGQFGVRFFQLPDDVDSTTPTLRFVSMTLRNRSRSRAFASAENRWVFSANEQNGIDMLDLNNPSFPVLSGDFVPEGIATEIHSVSIRDEYLYAAGWDAGVLVFKWSRGGVPANFNLENFR